MLKKSFTLFEIILSIILISIVYLFALNSFPKSSSIVSDKITLNNLKSNILSLPFNETVSIKCIGNSYRCFVILDEEVQNDLIEPFLNQTPDVYKYNKDLQRIEFDHFELEKLDRYEIVFEFNCKKNGICDELIVQTDEKVYIYSNLKDTPDTIDYISDINEYFDNKIQEVKDAF